MSYAMSFALQEAVFGRLLASAELAELVGSDIFDAMPSGTVPPLYVAIGPEKVRDASDKTGGGAWHEFTVSVVCDSAGFGKAKATAAVISDLLVDAGLSLSRGRLVALSFLRATAARIGTGENRRIDMIFRARVSDE